MAGIDSTESVQRLSIAGKVLQLAMSAVLAWLCAVHPTFAGSTGQTIPFGSAPIAPPETIDTIIVAGNRTTQNFVILSEIKLTPGSLVDSLSMREDMERLESLGIFSRAELTLLRLLDGSTALMIRVTELWYIWPGIYFAVDEQSPDRVAYGMILANSNFRGRREHLSVNGRIGYTQGGEFMWEIPYLSTARPRWSMKMSLAKITEQEPRYLRDRTGVEVQDFSANLVFSHRFNLENSISLRSRVSNREFRSISEHVVITPEIAGGAPRQQPASFPRDRPKHQNLPSLALPRIHPSPEPDEWLRAGRTQHLLLPATVHGWPDHITVPAVSHRLAWWSCDPARQRTALPPVRAEPRQRRQNSRQDFFRGHLAFHRFRRVPR